jgi:hypothetical protein
MKLALKIVALVVLVIGLSIGSCVGAIFWATSGVVKAGDRFVALCGAGDEAGAQAMGGACTGLPRGVRDPSWEDRRVTNNDGFVSGVVHAPDGTVIPLSLKLKKSGGVWHIVGDDVSAPEQP